jgi:hypothetical protein
MGRQIGGAVGLAVLVTLATTVARHAAGVSPVDAVLRGYHVALAVDAGIAAVAAITALALPGVGRLPSLAVVTSGEDGSGKSGLASPSTAAQP